MLPVNPLCRLFVILLVTLPVALLARLLLVLLVMLLVELCLSELAPIIKSAAPAETTRHNDR